MSQTIRRIVEEAAEGQRLDLYLAKEIPFLTRSRIQSLLEQHKILCNHQPAKKNCRLSGGEELIVEIPDAEPPAIIPEEIPLDIVYEDESLLVVNKKKGMVVHPASGHWSGTLVNALLYHCGPSLSGINGVARPGIIHRIDKDTSGLLLVAKTDEAHQKLANQIKSHEVKRIYHAIILGSLPEQEGVIDRPIGRHSIDRKKMAVTEKNSKAAITHYRVLQKFNGYSYVEFRLETGRTHQIRVHMASMGHPILGDTVYGPTKPKWDTAGQCLHAKDISFTHPISNEYMSFSCELPDYFENILKILRSKD